MCQTGADQKTVLELGPLGDIYRAKLMDAGFVHGPIYVEHSNLVPFHVERLMLGWNFVIGFGFVLQAHSFPSG